MQSRNKSLIGDCIGGSFSLVQSKESENLTFGLTGSLC